MKIHCTYDELIPLYELKQHPLNRNKHTEEQINRLSDILLYQGIRKPITVSKRSGYITAGHGRLLAALKLGLPNFPVNFQEYDNEQQEYADLTADNAIASWAEMDLSGVNLDIQDLGPNLDIEMLGLKDFKVEAAENKKEEKKCPHCGLDVNEKKT